MLVCSAAGIQKLFVLYVLYSRVRVKFEAWRASVFYSNLIQGWKLRRQPWLWHRGLPVKHSSQLCCQAPLQSVLLIRCDYNPSSELGFGVFL